MSQGCGYDTVDLLGAMLNYISEPHTAALFMADGITRERDYALDVWYEIQTAKSYEVGLKWKKKMVAFLQSRKRLK